MPSISAPSSDAVSLDGALIGALLDPPGRKLAEVAAHCPVGGRGTLDVVGRPPEREVAVPGRPAGTPVAVQRHADAAGVDEVGTVRTRAAELEVAVPEDDRPAAHAREQPLLTLLGLGGEAVVVSQR